MNKKLLLLPGDGIGPEVVAEARRVIQWFIDEMDAPIDIDEDLIGGISIEAHGTPMTASVFAKAKACDAILLGCVGGPKWDFNERDMRPGHGLLTLRKELNLFANLRPVKAISALHAQSTLKADVIEGVDLMIVRELTGGIYFGEPRGMEKKANGQRRGFNTLTYSTPEIRRIATAAFELARQRSGRVCSVDKANVLETSELWREEVEHVHRTSYPDIKLSHMYVDNCAMQLIRNPRQFDVIVTDNMFGDILSDCAAMISGSLGTLPSASLGELVRGGCRHALYEPVHGSAPDIAGQGISNPYGTLLSLELLLRQSFALTKEADLLVSAIDASLEAGVYSSDLAPKGTRAYSTSQIGDEVLKQLAHARQGALDSVTST